MVTIKIDERTKDGKALLEFLKNYSAKSESIKILNPTRLTDQEKKEPNAQTKKTFQETDQDINLEKFQNVDSLFEDLDN